MTRRRRIADESDKKLIDKQGKRTDGRTVEQLLRVKMAVGVVKNADGSVFIEFGKKRLLLSTDQESASKTYGTIR